MEEMTWIKSFKKIILTKKQLVHSCFAILKTGEKYKPIYPPDIDVSKLANEAINSQK